MIIEVARFWKDCVEIGKLQYSSCCSSCNSICNSWNSSICNSLCSSDCSESWENTWSYWCRSGEQLGERGRREKQNWFNTSLKSSMSSEGEGKRWRSRTTRWPIAKDKSSLKDISFFFDMNSLILKWRDAELNIDIQFLKSEVNDTDRRDKHIIRMTIILYISVRIRRLISAKSRIIDTRNFFSVSLHLLKGSSWTENKAPISCYESSADRCPIELERTEDNVKISRRVIEYLYCLTVSLFFKR